MSDSDNQSGGGGFVAANHRTTRRAQAALPQGAAAQKPILRLPPFVVLQGLHPDLAVLLSSWLTQRWPKMQVQIRHEAICIPRDLYVVDKPPPRPCRYPTLWLADLERFPHAVVLEQNLWCLPMPVTAGSFCLAVAKCLTEQ